MWVKSNSSSYPLQSIQVGFFVLFLIQWCTRTSPLDSWTSTKTLLSVGCSLDQCSPEVPEPWPRRARTGSRAISGSTGGTEVCMPISQRVGWQDSSQVPQHMVLMTEPKPDGAVTVFKSMELFLGLQLGSGWMSQQPMCEPVFSKWFSLFCFWTAPGFHKVLPGSRSSQKVTFVRGQMPNYS